MGRVAGVRLSKRQYEWVQAHSIQATVYLGLALAGLSGAWQWRRHPDADLPGFGGVVALIVGPALIFGFIFGTLLVLMVRRNYPRKPNPQGSRKDQRERERRAGW
jgi:hypothetical protein